jgi:ubiquinone/menaquinone biosynthesis C-methylase UbiE
VRPWYETAFRSDYLERYPHRDDDEARADVEAIIALIQPERSKPLLDLGCGAGRHLLAFCSAGFTRLTGLDLSDALLRVARERIEENDCDGVDLVCCDMREIPFEDHFGTVVSIFTSFGYFEADREDAAVLAAVYRALCPGGRLLVDTLNRDWTMAHLVPNEEEEDNGRRVAIRRTVSEDGNRIEKETRVVFANDVRVYRESVRMYSPEEMKDMFQDAGFVDVRALGSLGGEPPGPASRRLVVVGRKAPG